MWRHADGPGREDLVVRWENGGYVAEGTVTDVDVQYVLRLGPDFRTRQFLLFRDLPEPDLWLATDGHGAWGEVNGARRDELDGCFDVHLSCSAFTHTIAVRSLGLRVGGTGRVDAIGIDVETLALTVVTHRYTRVGERRWRVTTDASEAEFDTDTDGLLIDHGRFRRTMAGPGTDLYPAGS